MEYGEGRKGEGNMEVKVKVMSKNVFLNLNLNLNLYFVFCLLDLKAPEGAEPIKIIACAINISSLKGRT